ncbi:MAG: Imm7 family immunity protein [Phycisphaeraceae bacterium]
MYEYHGWVELSSAIDLEQTDPAVNQVRARLAEAGKQIAGWFDVRWTSNGGVVAVVHGFSRIWKPGVIEVFEWFAAEFPKAYGLLYVNDGDAGHDWTVYRLARGQVREFPDPFLSPHPCTLEHAKE